jgi:hypothetical protein
MKGAAARDPRFAGMEQRDADTDFDPTPARMYQNRIYRWMSPDNRPPPIGNPAGGAYIAPSAMCAMRDG